MHTRGSPRARSGGGGGSSWVPTRQHGTRRLHEAREAGSGVRRAGGEGARRCRRGCGAAHPRPTRSPGLARVPKVELRGGESTYTYSPSDAVAGRASHVDDVRAGRLPWHGGLGEVLPGTIGLRVVHFPPRCLTARISLRRPTSHITPRTGPTRFDVRSSPGGRAEWALGEHPHVPRGRVAAWLGAGDGLGSFSVFFPPPDLASTTLPRHAASTPWARRARHAARRHAVSAAVSVWARCGHGQRHGRRTG